MKKLKCSDCGGAVIPHTMSDFPDKESTWNDICLSCFKCPCNTVVVKPTVKELFEKFRKKSLLVYSIIISIVLIYSGANALANYFVNYGVSVGKQQVVSEIIERSKNCVPVSLQMNEEVSELIDLECLKTDTE